jgi:DNA-binding transcriptional LysR family regulator
MHFFSAIMSFLHLAMDSVGLSMELKWLEDYFALVELENFTAAAAARNLSQPAFSRRIQALEAWLGTSLVDRSRKPFRFTDVAREHEATLRNLLNTAYQVQNRIQYSGVDRAKLSVVAQHSLLVTPFLPQFLETLSSSIAGLNYSLVSENRDACLALFLRGGVDMLVIYETQNKPAVIASPLSVRTTLCNDEMILIGTPKTYQRLNGQKSEKTLPLLIYPSTSFFGGLIGVDALPRALKVTNASIACESAFSVGLKEMALASIGAAWVPRSIVVHEIQNGSLVALNEISPPIPMHVVAHLSLMSKNPAIAEMIEMTRLGKAAHQISA